MLSLKMPTVSPLISLPNSHYRNIEKPFSSSLKLCSIWKGIGDGQCFSPASNPIPKFRLAAASYSAGIDEKSVIQLPGELRSELMPKHVAVILDGNGRWAKNRGLPVQHGHKAGLVNLNNLALSCSEFGIKVLTVFAFSTENWKRSKVEVDFLMRYIEEFIQSYVMELIKRHNIRFSVIGNKSRVPKSLQSAISSAEEASASNRGMHFLMALDYSGRYEIAEASKKIAIKVEDGVLRAKDIDESVLQQEMMTTNLTDCPNPDLLIRTSGELRVSNFMLWQLAYTELYFPNKMFPDFEKADLVEALTIFQRRHRRYGERKN